jgi:hypothetical protein
MAQIPTTVQERFKKNVEAIAQVIQNHIIRHRPKYPNLPDPKLIEAGKTMLETYDAEKLIQIFIRHSKPYWPEIKKRNKDFFVTSADKIFGGFGFGDKVESFKLLFTAPDVIDGQTLTMFYDKFQEMVRQCLVYILEKLGNNKSISFGDVKFVKEETVTLKTEWDSTKPKK